MEELRIEMVCRLQMKDTMVVVRITWIKQENSPFLLMQIEPLFN